MKSISEKTVLISDLSVAAPSSAIADHPKHGCWYSMSYELADGTKGIMLTAEPHSEAPALKIPLSVSGIYRIFIGVDYFKQCFQTNKYGSLWLKLTGDRGFTRIGMEKYGHDSEGKYAPKVPGTGTRQGAVTESFNTIFETYWRTADLSGKDLVVSTPRQPYNSEFDRELTNIAFVRLEAVDTNDDRIEADLARGDGRKNMVAIWCAGALTGHTAGHPMYHPTDSRWFEDEFQSYRNSDFGIFCMEAIRGNLCLFRTEHGDVGSDDGSWDDSWADPLTEFTRLAHEDGMKMFVGMRLIGAGRPNAFNPINRCRFFWDNLQWAKRDKEGALCANLSLAYEEVRAHWLSLLREALDYGIDGVVLYFNRSQPYVMYEEPATTSFTERHGIDPRGLPEDDQRWQKHVAEYVTQFVREIRLLLDEKPGRELTAMCFKNVMGVRPGTIVNGCDPDSWIENRLLDYFFLDWSSNPDFIGHWKSLGNNRVKIYPSLMPRQQPGEEYARLAGSFYEKGADGFCIWDSERRIQRASEWNVIKHLGHRELLEHLARKASDYYRSHKLKLLRELNVAYSYTDG